MATTVLTDDALAEIITSQLPDLLARRPELKTPLYLVFLESFADKEELGHLRREFANFRAETRDSFERVDQRFEQVDQRFDGVDQRFEWVDQRFDGVDRRLDNVEHSVESLRTEMADGFKGVERQIDRLGRRWGIRSVSLFRETMSSLLEESFGVNVQRRFIGDEEFDVIISNGDHILVEITASVKRKILERLQRKRSLYTQETGVAPTRFILAVASIYSYRAQELREAGFEVIEPRDEEDET